MAVLFRLPLLHPPVWIEPPARKVPAEPLTQVRPILVEPDGPAPVVRGDCLKNGMNAARPCRWASCKHHLPNAGSMHEGVTDTCTLDIADRGEHSLEEVAEVLGVTRERIRQIENIALAKMKKRGVSLREFRKD